MSRFLGPIHHWLFSKVKLHEDLEQDIIQASKENFGDKVNNIISINVDKYGDFLPNKPLEDMIDTDNIHGWLQKRISISEIREAGILKDLFDAYGEEAINVVKTVYKEHGTACGKTATERGSLETAEDIYKTINNFLLNGMPCDNANNIVVSTDSLVEYKQVTCLHIGYWNEAGVNADTMYALRDIWTKAFITATNPEFKFESNSEIIGGSKSFTFKIFK